MKLTELKKVLKETVREVIQEELKDILLEAVKSPKVVTSTPIVESEVIVKYYSINECQRKLERIDKGKPNKQVVCIKAQRKR